jgi:sialidase-1
VVDISDPPRSLAPLRERAHRGPLRHAQPALTLARLEALQASALADDVPIDAQRMASWTEAQATEHFESGGACGPPTVASAAGPTAVFWAGMPSPSDGHQVFRIPALVRTSRRVLHAFCEARPTTEDHGRIDLVQRTSTDGGASWSALRVVPAHGCGTDAQQPATIGNPVPVHVPGSGELLLMYCSNAAHVSEDAIRMGAGGVGRRVWLLRSADDGCTWSEPRELTAHVKRATWTWYATGPGGGLVLADGTMAVPATHAEGVGPLGSGRDHSHVLLSSDGGHTWTIGGDGATHTNESTIAQMHDGSLLLNARSVAARYPNHRCLQRSVDGGLSWGTEWTCDELREPPPSGCHASTLAVRSSGTLFFGGLDVKHDAGESSWGAHGRARLALLASDDGGRTWPRGMLLNGGAAGYSSLCELSDDLSAADAGVFDGPDDVAGENAPSGDGAVLGVLYERGELEQSFFAECIAFEVVCSAELADDDGHMTEAPRHADRPAPTHPPPDRPPPSQLPFEVEIDPTAAPARPGPEMSAAGARGGEPLRYRPLHPQLFTSHFEDAWLESEVLDALDQTEGTPGGRSDASERALRALVTEETRGVYSFALLRRSFCDLLLEEVAHFEASGLPIVRPFVCAARPRDRPCCGYCCSLGLPHCCCCCC